MSVAEKLRGLEDVKKNPMRTHVKNSKYAKLSCYILKGSVVVSGKNECEWSALVKNAQRLSKDQLNENEWPEQQSVGKKTSLVPRIFHEYSAMRNYCNSGYVCPPTAAFHFIYDA
ncbi:hypothetical protein T07_13758 [Trichinella nelsoni]|uniref:Uncharacterized protein n=1 Tax=Trichinella nelsoni TaxID=6336 RepID=A0A0V0S376_9BILA|nr:hypothetical protein T07_13758 [Trichinella nelsoni]